MRYNKIYHITRFMCAPYLEESKPTFSPWFHDLLL